MTAKCYNRRTKWFLMEMFFFLLAITIRQQLKQKYGISWEDWQREFPKSSLEQFGKMKTHIRVLLKIFNRYTIFSGALTVTSLCLASLLELSILMLVPIYFEYQEYKKIDLWHSFWISKRSFFIKKNMGIPMLDWSRWFAYHYLK